MRLTLKEIEVIVQNVRHYFGDDAKVTLFGSRVDDEQKGGDIDLYIEKVNESDSLDKKLAFITELKAQLGEQKIDVVFANNSNRLIEQEAKKGILLDMDEIKLKKYLAQCEKHMMRIEEAFDDIQMILPLTAEKYNNLSKHEVQAIDQYLFRFAKLQDTLGQQVFSLLYKKYSATDEAVPFLDQLNGLEKRGFIPSAKEWALLRETRNKVSHQYDDEPVEMSYALNNIFNQKEVIKAVFENIKTKLQI